MDRGFEDSPQGDAQTPLGSGMTFSEELWTGFCSLRQSTNGSLKNSSPTKGQHDALVSLLGLLTRAPESKSPGQHSND